MKTNLLRCLYKNVTLAYLYLFFYSYFLLNVNHLGVLKHTKK